ncbi:MAG: Eco57I restriction-modification methylase domain-containing protein, partial [Candidatus Poribacteria bacterium]|nr:Eco57I restriction-modification methylase domain-containing protein [Candidatus Poribacteria bacterium]
LGYIFEKYINQKQMGAYYTKEDITEYISKNTIIPFLFDAARKSCKIAFEGDASVWHLLQEDPDRYIYDAVKKGVEFDLPEEIAVGIGDVSKRTDCWNTLASDEYALPTEIWREVVARRQRCETVRAKLKNGEVRDINDLITYNLNIRQFAQDVIENCEGPELLRAFWKTITEVTVLDPTCGSGAFLFAALNILEPLYEACLDRMQVFLDEVELISESRTSRRYNDFRDILGRIAQHPNREYFVLKSIIINNLYGVDIMEEAIEICKLRLFLKMVAQLENAERIEPLPDIDFNIQAGNTLVGYGTYEQVENAVTGKLDFDDTMKRIEEKVEDVEHLFKQFRKQQTELGGTVTTADKSALQNKLQALEDELNTYLAGEYNVDPSKQSDYKKWLNSHKPFHWFIAFYGILEDGGFDVIIGNPPYVEYSKVKKDYTIRGYDTEGCGNLYAFVFERSFRLLQQNGWKSMIIPHSAYCTNRMSSLQDLFHGYKQIGWVKTYGIRPSKLFVGADQRLAIYVLRQRAEPFNMLYASHYKRWNEQFREHLFALVEHADVTGMLFQNSVPKVYSEIEQNLWKKLSQFSVLGTYLAKKRTPYTIYFHDSPRYWVRAMNFAPYFWNERDREKISTHVKPLCLTAELDASIVAATLNSSLFYWWFLILSNCRDLTLREVRSFPIGVDQMDETMKQTLSELAADLMQDLRHHAQRKET